MNTSTTSTATDDAWLAQLREQVAIAVNGPDAPRPGHLPTITLLGTNPAVADARTVYRVNADLILLVAPPEFPDACAEEAAKMRSMQARLGPRAGRVVLGILGEGRAHGRSFLVVPRCTPLPSGRIRARLARWQIRGDVLRWLREAVALADAPDEHAHTEFLTSLTALQQMVELPDDIRRTAERLGQALASGKVQARHVPMHGDLWTGNVLRHTNGDLVLIDWSGSAPRGYGIYDLVRIADALRLPHRQLASEVQWHTQALGPSELTAPLHLLGALGYYARNLGEFPIARFVATAQRCCNVLHAAQDAM